MAWTYITPKPYPLHNIVARDDWKILVPVVQSDRSTEFDFTGWNAHAQVRKRVGGTIIADFDTYDSTIEFDGGNMYLIRDKDDTNIIHGDYVWDCKFLDPWGESRTLIIEDIFEIIGRATQ